ncbi:MAG: hypothetical protein K2K60_00220 [Clostridia bacterium]|nr:hypothetical protein [Clostridia bacterium]
MDIFEYASTASYFSNLLWVQLLVGGLCFLIVFIFQAVALFTIATREGYKHRWMAFIPFFNTYYIGVCAQKNRFYKIDTKMISLVAAIFEFVLFACFILYYVGCYYVAPYEEKIEATNMFGMQMAEYRLNDQVPANLAWAAWIYNYMYRYILKYLNLVYMLLQIVVLICFFQTYACRRYVLFTITSILFPIQGILFFVVRNNKGVNYREYLRNEQARQYRMYQQYQQQNFENNPYNQNPYGRKPDMPPGEGQNPYNTPSQTPPDDPFGDLGGGGNSGGSPFDDFKE